MNNNKNKTSNKNTKSSKNKRGFTLIELLVVVLIIGILAAIALPQYKMAVLKTQYGSIKSLTRRMFDAEREYFLINESFTGFIDDLDIDMPTPLNKTSKNTASADTQTYYYDGYRCRTYYHKTHNIQIACILTKSNNIQVLAYQQSQILGPTRASLSCITYTTDNSDMYNRLCQQETGRNTANTTAINGYTARVFGYL